MPDDILSCALHPLGTTLVVGLYGEVHMYHIVRGGLELVWRQNLKRPGLMRFSRGGNYFACTSQQHDIHVFNTVNCHEVALLKGHSFTIRWQPLLPLLSRDAPMHQLP